MTGKIVAGTTGGDILVFTASNINNGSYTLNGGATQLFSGFSAFTFDGNGGNDVFTLVNPASSLFTPSGGGTFDGGGQPGDSFSDLGGTADAGVYTPGGAAGSGSLQHFVDEVQQFTVSGGAGTFTLTFNGASTGSLAFNATAATVQAALAGLSTIGGVGGS